MKTLVKILINTGLDSEDLEDMREAIEDRLCAEIIEMEKEPTSKKHI